LAGREAQRRAKRRAANEEWAAHETAFAPVVVEEALPGLAAPVAPNEGGEHSVIEIVIGAATVRVAPGIDAATLTAVLRAVRAAT
jgi:transposase